MRQHPTPLSSATASPPGYLELLRRNPNYRRLWLAELVSFLGDWFNTIALYEAVDELSDSTEAVSFVFVAKTLPVFVMAPLAGPLIDRFDRKKLLIVTDVARAVGALGLIVAYWLSSLWLLMTVLVVMVCFAGIFIPAKTAVLPQLVNTVELAPANALSAGTWSAMLTLGAAAGGLVTSVLGVELSLVADALTFMLSAYFLLRLPSLQPDRAAPASRARGAGGFVAGLRYLRGRPYLSGVLSLKAGISLSSGALALIPSFATQLYRGGALETGIMFTARGLGAFLGAVAVRRVFGDAPATMRRLITPCFIVVGAGYLVLWVAGSLAMACLAFFVTALGTSTVWVASSILGQLASDDAYRGRVFSVEWGFMTLTMSGAAAIAGALVERAGWHLRDIALASAVASIVPAIGWYFVARRHARERGHATP